MKNIIEYIKDKSYYLLGGIVVVIILLIIINACSNSSGSYDKIEQKMVSAAKNYYANHEKKLPKEESGTVKVTINTLIEAELLKEVKDPNNKDQDCSGYVEVTKVGKEYSYTPFLVCKGNYEPKYLTDIVKESKQDEYGNGVYEMGGEYVYRGDDVKNYVSFNNQLWRIVKIDSEGDIKLVSAKYSEDSYTWDSAYNSDKQDSVGITTDYLHTDIRKTLNSYYDDNFDKDAKAKIVSKNLCIGKYDIGENISEEDYIDDLSEEFSVEKECSIIKENEPVGLLVPSDYKNASLDSKCIKLNSSECTNRNYMRSDNGDAEYGINTWLLNSSSKNTYQVLYLDYELGLLNASDSMTINYVIYINNKNIVLDGKGTYKDPYIIK